MEKMKLKYLGLLLIGLFLTSCGDDDDDDDGPELETTRSEIQLNTANNIIIPAYAQFNISAADLNDAVNSFTQAPGQDNLTAARVALQAAWLDWQDAAIFQFGPAEEMTLRSLFNTYPTDDDKIASNISSGSYTLESIDNRDAGGFPAIDFLLNGAADGDEAIIDLFIGDAESTNRIQYLNDLADLISNNAQEVLTRWEASGSDYLADFTSSEASGTDVGSSLGLIVNALNFHFERFTRDGKIAIPAGVRSAGIPRPFATEARYGEYSVELLIRSLSAFRRLYLGQGLNGQEGTGLSDYLVALGEDELSADILAQLDVVINDSQQLTDPLAELIDTNNDQLLDLFTEMQTLVILLKTDMPSIMGVSITFQDNDGD